MAETGAQKLVIAISSRALFNLDDAHRIFEQEGLDAYSDYQIEKEDDTLEPGQAFPMVKKLLALNSQLPDSLGIEVILLSRNSADTGLRVFNSIEHHGLSITRAAFCGGEPPWRYIEAFGCQLFLSAEGGDVRVALDNGVAAATLVSNATAATEDDQLRFAFDGDAVLFSDEAEQIYKRDGLDAFAANEDAARKQPLWADRSRIFWPHYSDCSKRFPPSTRPFAQRWSRRAPHRLMSGSSELCEPGTCASMNRYFWGA